MKTQKVPSAREMFNEGCAYLAAQHILDRAMSDKIATLEVALPMFVMSAFASELFLKCMHIQAHGAFPKTHDLQRLVLGLPEDVRADIEKHWNAHYKSFTQAAKVVSVRNNKDLILDFNKAIASQKDTFVRLRYTFSGKSISSTSDDTPMLDKLPYLLRNVLIQRNPEWLRGFRRAK